MKFLITDKNDAIQTLEEKQEKRKLIKAKQRELKESYFEFFSHFNKEDCDKTPEDQKIVFNDQPPTNLTVKG
jgi:hypothetical protein